MDGFLSSGLLSESQHSVFYLARFLLIKHHLILIVLHLAHINHIIIAVNQQVYLSIISSKFILFSPSRIPSGLTTLDSTDTQSTLYLVNMQQTHTFKS